MNKFIIILCFLLMGFSKEKFCLEHKETLLMLKNVEINAIAPASALDPQMLNDFKKIPDLKVNLNEEYYASKATLFHSNNDQKRFESLKKVLSDDPERTVWTLRGGYGCAKLIDNLRKLPKPKSEKFFIGYSDMTALHLFLTQEWGWRTIHGTCLLELVSQPQKDKENHKKVAEIISGKVKNIKITNLDPLNNLAKETKLVTSSLTGGNLTIVETSIGTNWEIKSHGKILFLEDINCKPYQIDRILLHLKQAGIFNNQVKAIILGEFISDENDDMGKVLKNFASNINIPIFKTNKFGHGKINEPIIYNVASQIKINHSGTFDLIMKLE